MNIKIFVEAPRPRTKKSRNLGHPYYESLKPWKFTCCSSPKILGLLSLFRYFCFKHGRFLTNISEQIVSSVHLSCISSHDEQDCRLIKANLMQCNPVPQMKNSWWNIWIWWKPFSRITRCVANMVKMEYFSLCSQWQSQRVANRGSRERVMAPFHLYIGTYWNFHSYVWCFFFFPSFLVCQLHTIQI